MAQRANRYATRTAPEAAGSEAASPSAAAETEFESREIPLALAPLVAPHKRRGRVTLRVERLPFRSRLSKGRNNGDRSWSLAPDELDDLIYSPPKGMMEAHTLCIRVVSLDGGDGGTLALLDYPIPACEPPSATAAAAEPPLHSTVDESVLRGLREELANARISIADCEAELAKARGESERLRTECHLVETELSQARSAWEGELRERLSAAERQATSELENARVRWLAEQSSDVAQSEAAVKDRIAREKARWQQEAEAARAQAEKSWQAAEDSRLAATERAWQTRLDSAVAEARAEGLAPRADDPELRRLRDELAAARIALVARQTELGQANATHEAERARWRQDSAATLSASEERWKADAASSLAAAEARFKADAASALAASEARFKADADARAESLEAQWRGQLERTIADWVERLARAETSLAEAQAGLEVSRSESAEAARLREDLSVARTALAEREAALAASQARIEEMRAGAEAFEAAEAERRQLKKDLASASAALAEHEAELREERSSTGHARKRFQQELETSLAEARANWKKDEVSRLEAAEAQGREKGTAELDEVMARLSDSETSLAQARAEIESLRHGGEDSELRRVKSELLAMQAVLAEREHELTQARIALERTEKRWDLPRQITIDRAPEDWHSEEDETEERQERARNRRRLARDIGMAGALAAILMVIFLRVEPSISAGIMPQIAPFTTRLEPLLRQVGLPVGSQEIAPAPLAPVVPDVQHSVIGVHDANIRSGPSTRNTVVATLPRDKPVTVVERRGDWALVQFNSTGAVMQQGWVFGSFLKDAEAAPVGTAPSPAPRS